MIGWPRHGSGVKPVLGQGLLREIVVTELQVLYFSLVVWFRKRSVASAGAFTYHKRSSVKTIVVVFGLLLVLEGALLHFMLARWSEVLAWISTALNVYALLYFVALGEWLASCCVRTISKGLSMN